MELEHLKETIIRLEEKYDNMRLNIGHLEAMYESEERQRKEMRKEFTELYSQVNLIKYKQQILTWVIAMLLPLSLTGIYNIINFILNKH